MSHSPLQIAASLQHLRCELPILIGREREAAALRAHLRARHSVFVSGPSDVGKSALLQAAYSEWDAEREAFPLFYCAESGTRRGIATHMLVNLFLHRGRLEAGTSNAGRPWRHSAVCAALLRTNAWRISSV